MVSARNNEPLWQAFNIIRNHYTGIAQNTPQYVQGTQLIVKCMLDLLDQIDNSQLSADEKVGLSAAKAYWLNGKKELPSMLMSLSKNIQAQITYRSPAIDNRMACIIQVLSVDNDHGNDFSQFLENIYHAGLCEKAILATVKKNFDFLPELQTI